MQDHPALIKAQEVVPGPSGDFFMIDVLKKF